MNKKEVLEEFEKQEKALPENATVLPFIHCMIAMFKELVERGRR